MSELNSVCCFLVREVAGITSYESVMKFRISQKQTLPIKFKSQWVAAALSQWAHRPQQNLTVRKWKENMFKSFHVASVQMSSKGKVNFFWCLSM